MLSWIFVKNILWGGEKMKSLIILQTTYLLAWVTWAVGFPIYKKIRKENMCYDGTILTYISVLWIFATIFCGFKVFI